MPEGSTTMVLAAVSGLLAVVAMRYRRQNRLMRKQMDALLKDAVDAEQGKVAALRALNEAVQMNAQLRKVQPAIVIAGVPFVQSYATVKHFSMN